AAFPFEVVAAEVLAENLPWPGVQQMPGAHEVQGRIGRSETADVQDPGEASAGHENVAGYEIAVRHHVTGSAARQSAQDGPQVAAPGYVQETFAVAEARLHPRVVGRQVAAPAAAGELPAPRVDPAYVADELGQVVRERDRAGRVVVGRHDSRYPGL